MTTVTLYLKTHDVTSLKYLGITSYDPYTYEGSGVVWKKHIRKHGRYDVTTEVLYEEELPDGDKTSLTFKEICVEYSRTLNIVEDDGYANCLIESGVLGAMGNDGPRKGWVGEGKYKEYLKKSKDKYNKEDCLSTDTVNFVDKYHTPTSTHHAFEPSFTPEEETTRSELKKSVTYILSYLTAREERVLRKRFGIGLKEDYTLEEIGQEFSVTRDRIRQIEAKGLRKLKDPSLARKLRSFLPDVIEVVGKEADEAIL